MLMALKYHQYSVNVSMYGVVGLQWFHPVSMNKMVSLKVSKTKKKQTNKCKQEQNTKINA